MITRRYFISTLAAGLGAGAAIPLFPAPPLPCGGHIQDRVMARRWRAATDLREVVDAVMEVAVRALGHGRDPNSPSWFYPPARRVDWPLPDQRQLVVFAGGGTEPGRRAVVTSVLAHVIWTHVRHGASLALYDPWPWHLALALLTREPLTPSRFLAGRLSDGEWRLLGHRARELAVAKATVIRSCKWRPLPSCPVDVVHVGRRPVFYRDVLRSGPPFVAVLDAPVEPPLPRRVACYRAEDGDPIRVVPAGQSDLPGVVLPCSDGHTREERR